MQHTEKRKFNIIETSDPFSPEALNENTRKVEEALDAHEAEVKEVTDGLDARLQIFEAVKIATGTIHYPKNADEQFIEVPFYPKAVFACTNNSNSSSVLVIRGLEESGTLRLSDNGFTIRREVCERTLVYLAFG